jgi:S1-C subfamily serine protease
VIIDGKRGFILTNAHVIERSGNIKVVLEDEREFEAKIVANRFPGPAAVDRNGQQ